MVGYVVGLVRGYRADQDIANVAVSQKMGCRIGEMESTQVGALANKADAVSACRLEVLLTWGSC